MGNIIGIKLADGSFYPVMEEGQPLSKKLELTTVRDGQTTVHLDLYRSATGTMEDAEYVDTLMIENLVPHAKQEHSLDLKINLDENNMLSAEIDDPETGASTNSKVSLITLKKEELQDEPDFSITSESSESQEDFTSLDPFSLEDSELEDISALQDEIDLAVPAEDYADDLSIDDSFNDFEASDNVENLDILEEPEEDIGTTAMVAAGAMAAGAIGGAILADNLSEKTEEDDLESLDLTEDSSILEEDYTLPENLEPIPENILEEDIIDSEPTFIGDSEELSELPEEIELVVPSTEEFVAEDLSISESFFDEATTEESLVEESLLEESSETEENTLDDFTLPEEDTINSEEIDFSLDSLGIPASEEMEAFSEGDSSLTEDELANLGGFGTEEQSLLENSEMAEEENMFDKNKGIAAGVVAGGLVGGAILANSLMDEDQESEMTEFITENDDTLEDEELPNFDNFDIEDNSLSSFDMDDDTPFSFDSLPEFDEIPELQENSSESIEIGDFELPDFDSTPVFSDNIEENNTNNNFATMGSGEDDLFDSLYEESYKETEKSKKRTTIPVIVCVICALICVGALVAILWLTKPEIFGKAKVEKEENVVILPVEEDIKKLPEEEVADEEDLSSAKVDEIVITPEPVVPEIPEPKVEAVPSEVTYRIKWGDTLWDLAESYYQNPWLYPKIAKENNIKNPDVIISGTDIIIPPLN